jgi:hypothetical protein
MQLATRWWERFQDGKNGSRDGSEHGDEQGARNEAGRHSFPEVLVRTGERTVFVDRGGGHDVSEGTGGSGLRSSTTIMRPS